MSDGGGESSSREKTSHGKKKLGRGDDFALSIAKIAVAQVCDATGFQGIYPSALELFSDLAVRYIHQVGKDATFYADLCGRCESNALDIIQGLQDLGSPQGFSGASERVHCLASSGVVREISRYVSEEGENPFVYQVPNFPVVVTERKKEKEPTFAQAEDDLPLDGHIPDWLPVFPVPQTTYSQDIEVDNATKTIEPFIERKEVVDDLHQHNKACNGSEVPIQLVTNNPFLAPPLKFGERKVSSVVIPLKLLDGSAMREIEEYVPCFEMPSFVDKPPVKSPLKDIEEVKEKVSPETRPKMQFKLKTLKKSLVDSEKICSLFVVSNGKREGKRKVEQIIEESMDIDEESTEL